MYRCPYCLDQVDRFVGIDGAANRDLSCPACGEPVPLLYARDYQEFPPVIFSITGPRGHGKSVYLASLLFEFDQIAQEWPGFHCRPLDEEGIRAVRDRQRDLERGLLPEPSVKNFPKPVILRMEGVPEFGRCQLLLYDTSGEAFETAAGLEAWAGYVLHSPVVVFMVSLKDADPPSMLVDFLTVYVEAVSRLGGDPRAQTLVVVLMKGDELPGRESLPESVRGFLESRVPVVGLTPLEELSAAIEVWLEAQRPFAGFARAARAEFRQVRFAIVSSLGSAPLGRRLQVGVKPRGVLAPIVQLMALAAEDREARRQADEERRLLAEEAEAEQRERLRQQAEAEEARLKRAARREQGVRQAWLVVNVLSTLSFLAACAAVFSWGSQAARGAAPSLLGSLAALAPRLVALGATLGLLMTPSLYRFAQASGREYPISTGADVALWIACGLICGGVFLGLLLATLFGIGFGLGA